MCLREGYIQHVDHQPAGVQAEGCRRETETVSTDTSVLTQHTIYMNKHISAFSDHLFCWYDSSEILSRLLPEKPLLLNVTVTGESYTDQTQFVLNDWSILNPHEHSVSFHYISVRLNYEFKCLI